MTTPAGNFGSQNDAPFTLALSMSASTVYAPGRAFRITATTAGTVTLTLAGANGVNGYANTAVVTVPVGDTQFDFAVTTWAVAATAVISGAYNLL